MAATAAPTTPRGDPRPSDSTDAALKPMVVEQLRHAHALQVGALEMFDGMLDAVRREQTMPEVADLLANMLNAFEQHRDETARHEREVRARLTALGARPARMKELGMRMAARPRVFSGRIGGQNHGANARDAYVFEHLEIATYHLLEKVAERAGDSETGALARTHRGDNCEMGHKIRRNWENVLSLLLASEGVPPARDRQGSSEDAAPTGTEGELLMLPTREDILQALTPVMDPELRRSIVDLGMVRRIDVAADGRAMVVVSLTTPGCPIKSHFEQAVTSALMALDGITAVQVDFDVLSDGEKQGLQEKLGREVLPRDRSPRWAPFSALPRARAAWASPR